MPNLYIIAGPNGAGKTTAAMALLPQHLGCIEFVNADSIAKGLSPFNPKSADMSAGRLMLARIHQLADEGKDFAFETTLASRSFFPFILALKDKQYKIHLYFLWLESSKLALHRVSLRGKAGGHTIPKAVVQRRYEGGLKNFFTLYMPIVDTWYLLDSSGASLALIAMKPNGKIHIEKDKLWQNLASGK